jgi:hypothetical protein
MKLKVKGTVYTDLLSCALTECFVHYSVSQAVLQLEVGLCYPSFYRPVSLGLKDFALSWQSTRELGSADWTKSVSSAPIG